MAKEPNPNIGFVHCIIKSCDDIGALRIDKGGVYYYDCPNCGRIKPNYEAGQDIVLDNAVMYGDKMPPPETPTWIAEQWPMQKLWRYPKGREPLGGGEPVNVNVNEPEPAPESIEPVNVNGPPAPPEESEPVNEPVPELEPEPESDEYEPGFF